jgi:hypothetical protein
VFDWHCDENDEFNSNRDDNSYPWGGPGCSVVTGTIPIVNPTQDDLFKLIASRLGTAGPARRILGAMGEDDGSRQMKSFIPLDDNNLIQNWLVAMNQSKLLHVLWVPHRPAPHANSPPPSGCYWLLR